MESIAYIIRFRLGILILLPVLLGMHVSVQAQTANQGRDVERYLFHDGWESNTFDYDLQVQRERYTTLSGTFSILAMIGGMSGMFLYDFLAADTSNGLKFKDLALSGLSGIALATPFILIARRYKKKADSLTIQTSSSVITQPSGISSPVYGITLAFSF